MTRWQKITRAVIGTGLTFAAGAGGITSIVGSVFVFAGKGSWHDVFELAGKFSVAGFLLGLAFSGILAATARRRRFTDLSLPRFTTLGVGAGLLYFMFIAINGGSHWSLADAIANLVLLTVVGGGSAAGILMLARRGRDEVESDDQTGLLGEGDAEAVANARRAGEAHDTVRH